MATCSSCGGSGVRLTETGRGYRETPCSNCGGTGKVTETCPTCKGNGQTAPGTTCPTCNGSCVIT